jgi:hypothetical protein
MRESGLRNAFLSKSVMAGRISTDAGEPAHAQPVSPSPPRGAASGTPLNRGAPAP